MKILVGYASRHGSTREIASRIAGIISSVGRVDVELRSAADITEFSTYDAVIFGSGVYSGSWPSEATELVRRHATVLAQCPVWLFSVGSFGDRHPIIGSLIKQQPREMAELQAAVHPRAYRVFAGVIHPENWPVWARFMFRLLGGRAGDNRQWSDVYAWAKGIARDVGELASSHPSTMTLQPGGLQPHTALRDDRSPWKHQTPSGDDWLPDHREVIEVHVAEVRQLFNAIDPSPFRERDLDPKAEEFIVGWAREAHRDAPLALSVYIDSPAERSQDTAMLPDAIHAFFSNRAEMTRRRLRQLLRVGRTSLVIGVTVLAAFLVLGDILARLVAEGRFGGVIRESLLIGGWVAMWRPMEILLYDWWPVRAEARLADRLASMPIRIVNRGTVNSADWPGASSTTPHAYMRPGPSPAA